MDMIKEKDEIGLRTKSFRDEDYNTRRVFLRSYPLQWGGEDEAKDAKEEDEEEMKKVSKESNSYRKKKMLIKNMIVSVIDWGGGKVLVLRKFKDKLAIHVIACIPLSFKRPTALICAS